MTSFTCLVNPLVIDPGPQPTSSSLKWGCNSGSKKPALSSTVLALWMLTTLLWCPCVYFSIDWLTLNQTLQNSQGSVCNLKQSYLRKLEKRLPSHSSLIEIASNNWVCALKAMISFRNTKSSAARVAATCWCIKGKCSPLSEIRQLVKRSSAERFKA